MIFMLTRALFASIDIGVINESQGSANLTPQFFDTRGRQEVPAIRCSHRTSFQFPMLLKRGHTALTGGPDNELHSVDDDLRRVDNESG